MISPINISPAPIARAQSRLRFALAAIVVMLLGAPSAADAQGLVQGVQQGAREGNKAAGPGGGVVGDAWGGWVGLFPGVLGAEKKAASPAANEKQGGSAKNAKGAKGAKGSKQNPVLPQDGAPQLTAEPIVAKSAGNID